MTLDPEKFFKEFGGKINEEKGEFAKWMDELGNDLMESGVGNIAGKIAGSSSGGVGNFFDGLNKIYEAGSDAEETVSRLKFIIHLKHLNRGVSYDPDCKEYKS